MFVSYNKKIVNSNIIAHISYDKGVAKVFYINKQKSETVTGEEATNLINVLYPELLHDSDIEPNGPAWILHNIIGHPVMQILTLLRLPKLANKIHDLTIPSK